MTDGELDYQGCDPELRRQIDAAIAEIDLKDSNSVLFFGTRAQQDLTTVSDEMLEGVRNKDVGPAGSALSEMLAAIRGFDMGELDPNKSRGFLGRILGAGKPVAKILQRYEEVRGQIETIGDRLETHKGSLLRDVALLDRLYAKTLSYFHGLATYIAAGDEHLRRLDQDVIPGLEKRVTASGDVVQAQELRDLRTIRDDLDRRVHDLRLTRQVAMQSLPSIRLVQENDKGLIAKITSVLANTVPLWRQQLAQAVTIFRSRDAGQTLKEATDLTNTLLLANAENLRQANAEVRQQMERGVFDIEAVKKANELLVATVEDSLRIADEAKQRRAAAEIELVACETKLRETLATATLRSATSPAARR
ncbi:MAG: toxic anion resistance protein [Rhodospirillales bacterium]